MNAVAAENVVDLGPRIDHASPMPNADPYLSKRHRFYAEVDLVMALDELAMLNKRDGRKGKTRSEILANATAQILRLNAARLRKAGCKLPKTLFTK